MLKNVLLAIASIAFFLAACEIGAYLLPEKYKSMPLDLNNFKAEKSAEPDDLLGYRLRKNVEVAGFRCNNLGFIGKDIEPDKPDDVYRIVCFGGSTTLGTGADLDRYAYPGLLQALFDKTSFASGKKVQVINAGVYGYNSWHSVLRLNTVLNTLHPDMILLMDGLNDVLASKAMTLTALRENNVNQVDRLKLLTTSEGVAGRIDSLFSKLQFYRLLKKYGGNLLGKEKPSGYNLHYLDEKFEMFGYRDNMEKIYQELHSRGVAMCVVNCPWKVKTDGGTYVDYRIHPEHFGLYLAGRRLVAAANNAFVSGKQVIYVDPQRIFDAVSADKAARRQTWSDDIHLSRKGNLGLAQEIYDVLMSSKSFLEKVGEPKSRVRDDEIGSMFPSVVLWRGSQGCDWPSLRIPPLKSRIVKMNNIKKTKQYPGTGFVALECDDKGADGVIEVEMETALPVDARFYPRVSCMAGESVAVYEGANRLFLLENKTNDGLWTPMASWYGLHIAQPRLTIILKGENAQLWLRDSDIFFQQECDTVPCE